MNKEGKEGSYMVIFLALFISLIIASLWNSIPFIKNIVHVVLNPTAGALLGWNLTLGMVVVVLFITLITTFAQKYGTDQETLKEMKKEQKILQEEMKKFRDHPEKLMELQKKQFEFIPKTFRLTMRPIIYTAIPLILFFRWFMDYFSVIPDFRFFGFFSWFWFYLIGSIIFSSILRKILKVA